MSTAAESTLRAWSDAPPASLPGTRVVAVVNSKGGVGKTTLANNLAVFAQTVDASLPVLVIGLDDSPGPDDMFALDDAQPEETLYSALRRGSFDSAIRPGRYGVHYVPSSPRVSQSLRDPADPQLLREVIRKTAFRGLVFIDARSDFGDLTRSAIAASDLCVVPVADIASLLAAKQVFDLLEAWGRPRSGARVLLSMIDLRIKYRAELCRDALGLLVGWARRLDLPLFQTYVARSPRVQALAMNPEGQTYSIMEEAIRTSAHRQMGELAEELLEALGSLPPNELATPRIPSARGSADPEEPVAWLHPRTPEATFAVQQDGQEPLRVSDFPFFIGRYDPGVMNDLAIQDLHPWQVSRRHAHFERREGRIGVMDLGSTLGTWVDGHQLGGPTADPGPVLFGARGGVLILGEKRTSPYVFDVEVRPGTAKSARNTAAPSPLHSAALAALVS